MENVLVAGAGKIGSLISVLLANSNDYQVYLADINDAYAKKLTNLPHIHFIKIDVKNHEALSEVIKKNQISTVVSSLPYYCNLDIAKIAKELKLNYFDLTEDVSVSQTVSLLSKGAKNSFVPQCGLAPGFISIVTNDLMHHFTKLDTVKMRVGALPINVSNALNYSLTWSTEGLINEYGNFCKAIMNGEEIQLLPLDDLEKIKIDGLTYEAFNTSGGIGSLVDTYKGKVKSLSYKTIRYPGHCQKMRFLMRDLKLNEDRETLKKILERVIPTTQQDVVLVYVSVSGTQDNLYREDNYVKKFYPKIINGIKWTAIQLTTASALCAVLDIVLNNQKKYAGLVRQEQFSLTDITTNRFGQYYA